MTDRRLRQLLQKIEPMPDDFDRKANDGFNGFSMVHAKITDINQFTAYIGSFFHHIECALLLTTEQKQPDLDFYAGRAWNLLSRKFGSNSMFTCFQMAQSGTDNGLLNVMKSLTELFSTDYAQNAVKGQVIIYWNPLSPDEIFADANDYIKQYHHLVPSDVVDNFKVRILASFRQVLEAHPFNVRFIKYRPIT